MKRMKTFFIYALIIIGLWVFSDIIIYLSLNGTYNAIHTKVYVSSPEVTISESKATYINGYVKGSIKNNTEDIIDNKYIKIELYSERDVNLGTKYVEIDNLHKNETRDFEMWYEFTDVDYAIVKIVDNAPNISGDEFSSRSLSFGILLGKLMLLYFM